MKRKQLWEVSILTVAEAEESVAEQFEAVFLQKPSSYTSLETGKVVVSVYLPLLPKQARLLLIESLARIQRCGINIGCGTIRIRKMPRENWANSWKRHFKPLLIGGALLIKPSWSRRRIRNKQAMIILDPGLSFGTGQHPTTSFCLEQLVDRRKMRRALSFLDMGTGSGILAIAAAKLGYAPVDAFDFDPESVRIARDNARRNRVQLRIQFRHADLTKLPRRSSRKYDLICANLISNLLISERNRIVARIKPGGIVILAGILGIEFAQVRQAYEEKGGVLTASRTEKEWCSGAFWFKGTCEENILKNGTSSADAIAAG